MFSLSRRCCLVTTPGNRTASRTNEKAASGFRILCSLTSLAGIFLFRLPPSLFSLIFVRESGERRASSMAKMQLFDPIDPNRREVCWRPFDPRIEGIQILLSLRREAMCLAKCNGLLFRLQTPNSEWQAIQSTHTHSRSIQSRDKTRLIPRSKAEYPFASLHTTSSLSQSSLRSFSHTHVGAQARGRRTRCRSVHDKAASYRAGKERTRTGYAVKLLLILLMR